MIITKVGSKSDRAIMLIRFFMPAKEKTLEEKKLEVFASKEHREGLQQGAQIVSACRRKRLQV